MPFCSPPVPPCYSTLWGARFVLAACGTDPCDGWPVDYVLSLPPGLHYVWGAVSYQCASCGEWEPWPLELEEFDPEASNYCGGSPRCLP